MCESDELERKIKGLAEECKVNHCCIAVQNLSVAIKLFVLLGCEVINNRVVNWHTVSKKGTAVFVKHPDGIVFQLSDEQIQRPAYQNVSHLAFEVSDTLELVQTLIIWADKEVGIMGNDYEEREDNKYFVHLPLILREPLELLPLDMSYPQTASLLS